MHTGLDEGLPRLAQDRVHVPRFIRDIAVPVPQSLDDRDPVVARQPREQRREVQDRRRGSPAGEEYEGGRIRRRPFAALGVDVHPMAVD
ncbi:hypothetical protein GCM10023353_33490 [Tomitella cavernea]|uniref:Uncharacterized protein n=1 Tax=Tomitella cavernea TaxID=1387982 RepID=A0ABP9CXZ4_9ACTN